MEIFSTLLALLYGEFTAHRWIPLTKTSDTELWCFFLSAPEQAIVRLVIWDAIMQIILHVYCLILLTWIYALYEITKQKSNYY